MTTTSAVVDAGLVALGVVAARGRVGSTPAAAVAAAAPISRRRVTPPGVGTCSSMARHRASLWCVSAQVLPWGVCGGLKQHHRGKGVRGVRAGAMARTTWVWVRNPDTNPSGSRPPRRGRLTPPSVMLFGVSRARADRLPEDLRQCQQQPRTPLRPQPPPQHQCPRVGPAGHDIGPVVEPHAQRQISARRDPPQPASRRCRGRRAMARRRRSPTRWSYPRHTRVTCGPRS